jgi:flagellar hook-basal body complex protein FliE
MDISSNKAASAYAAQMRNAMGGGEAEDTAAGAAGGAFSDLLSKAIDTVVESQNSAETAKMQAVTGKIDTAELVTALASAELTLNTVVAIRDRVISAYQDIIRMPM